MVVAALLAGCFVVLVFVGIVVFGPGLGDSAPARLEVQNRLAEPVEVAWQEGGGGAAGGSVRVPSGERYFRAVRVDRSLALRVTTASGRIAVDRTYRWWDLRDGTLAVVVE